ncbi:hypothetical protein COV19_07535 [Candidatus Woesearchaeota archaeon CG10_big_fil_rev_8_21_14_0_10_44_13]|nr:MAG: hypothetical protein COV19_07535 [Candidatus Woesearchaeota archaeon CG10_big_fil_rev_8_21_14_0_10_44_13]
MKKIIILLMLSILIIGCAGQAETSPEEKEGSGQGRPSEGMPCPIAPGEWQPQQGECPGTTSESRQKCNEFCEKHPDCCKKGQEGGPPGSRNNLVMPEADEILSLTRNYPSVIKVINQGPAIYGQGEFKVISDDTLDDIKETGFNTIQLLTINDCTGEKCVMDEASKAVLLNDIVKAKKKGLAVWVAFELVNAPPGSDIKLPAYSKFKTSYLQYCRETGELMEEYKVEYVTANNEPDLFLQEQTQWGSAEQIDKYIVELMPSANAAVKEKFTGKVINKVTQPKKRSAEVIAASFRNVDIAGVDVGPPIAGGMSYEDYTREFDDYRFYAALAEKAGKPWMNAEYWQQDFFAVPDDFIKQNQVRYAQVSFDAYLAVEPKGAGYTWNDFGTFSLEPNGESTRLAIKKFFGGIG